MGITLCNLFEGYPQERLAAFDLCPSSPAEVEIPSRFWRSGRPLLDGFSVLQPWPHFPRDTGRISRTYQSGQYGLTKPNSLSPGRIKTAVSPLINELTTWTPGFFSREFVRWVDDFRPEVIFSQAAPGYLLRLLNDVAERWSLPIVPHITDDYLEWYPTDSAVGKTWIRFLARRRFARMLLRSPVRLVISQAMAREYEVRYGGAFEVVMNAATLSLPSPPPSTKGSFRLVYAGILEPDRWRVLASVGEALSRLQSRTDIHLHVYSLPSELDRHRLALSKYPNIHLEGFVPQDQLSKVLQNAHALLHVESFQPEAVLRTRLAMSTKIGIYLASGRPVVAVGPGEVASMQHLAQVGAGPLLSTPDPESIAATLASLALDPGACARFSSIARENAQMLHNPERIRHKVWGLLRQACEQESRLRGMPS